MITKKIKRCILGSNIISNTVCLYFKWVQTTLWSETTAGWSQVVSPLKTKTEQKPVLHLMPHMIILCLILTWGTDWHLPPTLNPCTKYQNHWFYCSIVPSKIALSGSQGFSKKMPCILWSFNLHIMEKYTIIWNDKTLTWLYSGWSGVAWLFQFEWTGLPPTDVSLHYVQDQDIKISNWHTSFLCMWKDHNLSTFTTVNVSHFYLKFLHFGVL